MDIMALIAQLLQQKQQPIISPLPQSDSPGGYNDPTQPGLNYYYQRENAMEQAARNNPMKINPQSQPMQSQPSFIPQAQAAGQNPFADFTTAKVSPQYAGLIAHSAQQNGVDPNIFASLLFSEHGFQPTGVSYNRDSKGKIIPGNYDRGIAQINSVAHPEVSDQQANDPNFAIPYAARILGQHIKTLGLKRGIVAYNTGSNGSMAIADPTQHPYYKKVTGGLSQGLKQRLGL